MEKKQPKIKKCPFCGREPKTKQCNEETVIFCTNPLCPAAQDQAIKTRSDAIKNWNKRSRADAPVRLYVFPEFCPAGISDGDAGGFREGLAFAVARDVEEAKRMIHKRRGNQSISEWGPMKSYPVGQKVCEYVLG